MYDVVVVGGSYAGMSAALQIARARRQVLVVDAGLRRNRFAAHSHGFLGQDGRDPAAIAAVARSEVLAYPNVTWIDGEVMSAVPTSRDHFTISLETGTQYAGRRLVLAAGVTDILPDIPGLAECWGRTVFHCPYCHGYELANGDIGVLATSPASLHHALMLPDWGKTTYFTRGLFEPSAAEHAYLERRGVVVERALIQAVNGDEHRLAIQLEDGRVLAFAGLFLAPTTRISTALVTQLGCALEQGPTGAYVQTDARKATSVHGVFACGDLALPAGSVAIAVGDGARAGSAAHQSLIFDSDTD